MRVYQFRHVGTDAALLIFSVAADFCYHISFYSFALD